MQLTQRLANPDMSHNIAMLSTTHCRYARGKNAEYHLTNNIFRLVNALQRQQNTHMGVTTYCT